MSYSRTKLNEIQELRNYGGVEHTRITQELIDKLTTSKPLTQSEADYACSCIHLLHLDNPDRVLSPITYQGCQIYWFMNRYLAYWNDFEGWGQINELNGALITPKQKVVDVNYLEGVFQTWQITLEAATQANPVLNFLRTEMRYQMKLLERFCKQSRTGYFRELHLGKGLILHTKFIYHLVEDYFEDLGRSEITFDLWGHKVLIDSFSYIHVLARHYAPLIKDHQTDKTYIYDENIDYKKLPSEILKIIEKYKQNIEQRHFNTRSIYLSFNNELYCVWFRPLTRAMPGNIQQKYLRLQSFYPVRFGKDYQKIRQLTKVSISPELAFFI